MDELLVKIKEQLQSALSYIRAGDIFITPHLDFLPQGVKKPCIGIKDGKVEHSYGAGGSKELTMWVRLAIFVDLKKDEAVIIGDEATGSRGVIGINKDCIAALDGELLAIAGMEDAEIVEDLESRLWIVQKGDEIQQKILGLKYTRSV